MQRNGPLYLLGLMAVLAASLWGALCTSAQQPPTDEAAVSPEEAAIRHRIVEFVQRYNAHQAEQLAELFAPDARLVARDGSEANGTEQIQQAFAASFAASPNTQVSCVVDSIRFLTPDVAVEEGATTLFPDGETLTARSRYTVLHVRKEGRWLMQSVRVEEEEQLSAYGQLQSLEWLLGDWIDEGRDEVVEASFHWDDNKSFLLEEFQVVRQGEVVLKGSQRIGWDPQARQIRSWIFDNAGGFGQATWTPTATGFLCQATGVSSEGQSSAALRQLSRMTPDRIVWTATERISGGEQLPDLEVTMVRRPPQPE